MPCYIIVNSVLCVVVVHARSVFCRFEYVVVLLIGCARVVVPADPVVVVQVHVVCGMAL